MESHGDLVLKLCPKQMCNFEWQQTNPVGLSHLRRKARQKGGQWGCRGEERRQLQNSRGAPRTGEPLYLVLGRSAVHLNLCTQRLQNIFSWQKCFPLIVVFKSESKPHNAGFSFCEMSKIDKSVGMELKLVCDTQVLGGWTDWGVIAKACAFHFVVVKCSEIMVIVAQLCEYTKNHWIVHVKWMNWMVCELHFGTAIVPKSEPTAKHWEVSHVKLDALLLLKKQVEAPAILGRVTACDMSDHSLNPLLELWCWYLCLYIFFAGHSARGLSVTCPWWRNYGRRVPDLGLRVNLEKFWQLPLLCLGSPGASYLAGETMCWERFCNSMEESQHPSLPAGLPTERRHISNHQQEQQEKLPHWTSTQIRESSTDWIVVIIYFFNLCVAREILVPPPGIEPAVPNMEVLTTGPPESESESHSVVSNSIQSMEFSSPEYWSG